MGGAHRAGAGPIAGSALGAMLAAGALLKTASRKASEMAGTEVMIIRHPMMTSTKGSKCPTMRSSEILATVQAANRLTPKGGVIMPKARLTTMMMPKCTGSIPK